MIRLMAFKYVSRITAVITPKLAPSKSEKYKWLMFLFLYLKIRVSTTFANINGVAAVIKIIAVMVKPISRAKKSKLAKNNM